MAYCKVDNEAVLEWHISHKSNPWIIEFWRAMVATRSTFAEVAMYLGVSYTVLKNILLPRERKSLNVLDLDRVRKLQDFFEEECNYYVRLDVLAVENAERIKMTDCCDIEARKAIAFLFLGYHTRSQLERIYKILDEPFPEH